MIKWEKDTSKYTNGEWGILGEIKIFYLGWSNDGSKPVDKDYYLQCKLPCLRECNDYYNMDEGKQMAERLLKFWLKKAGLKND